MFLFTLRSFSYLISSYSIRNISSILLEDRHVSSLIVERDPPLRVRNRGVVRPHFFFDLMLYSHVKFCIFQHCHCSTGTSTICNINRISIYVLLFIMISLASLTYDLFHNLKGTPGHKKKQSTLNILSVVFIVTLVAIAFWFDTDDKNVDNGVLNIR